MSGIEVAGLILAAFSIAIEALDKYREVATRAGLFYQIKLEDQPYWKKWSPINDENIKFALDVHAALDWLQDVEGEAGPEYASAVEWCLVALRPDRWRQEMLRKVVKPIERCHQYLVPPDPQ